MPLVFVLPVRSFRRPRDSLSDESIAAGKRAMVLVKLLRVHSDCGGGVEREGPAILAGSGGSSLL